jgi:predicted RecA/RadA family phage recombinase
MKNYIQPGDNLTLTAPANVVGGQGVLVGEIFGVVASDAASGKPMDITTRGVFRLPKVSADVLSVGEAVYFDTVGADVGEQDTAHATKIGHAVEAAGNGATTVAVKLLN